MGNHRVYQFHHRATLFSSSTSVHNFTDIILSMRSKVIYAVVEKQFARFAQAGQLSVVRVDAEGERIPLTIADFDRNEGWISMVVQDVGVTSHQICSMISFVTGVVFFSGRGPGDSGEGVLGGGRPADP